MGDDHSDLFVIRPRGRARRTTGQWPSENPFDSLVELVEERLVMTNEPPLDALSACDDPYRGNVSLRWILVHMIEETARHVGHLDIMREAIDGQTGD